MRGKETFARIAAAIMLLGFLCTQGIGIGAAQEPVPQTALGTAFTYQGQLAKDGRTVTATCEMTFRLYAEEIGGSSLAAPITRVVTVSDGLLTASLDFGPGVFAGEERWLEIDVLCPGDVAATTLPRVNLTAAPQALYAGSAPWSGLSGVPSGLADGVDNDTTYLAGAGLHLEGNVFSVEPRNFQRRVTGICTSGRAIREIYEDGTVACEETYSGDITAVQAGTGLSGGASSGEVTLSVNTATIQRRVDKYCEPGESIRMIREDGSVVCELDDSSLYHAGNQLELVGETLNVVEGIGSDLDADLLDGQHGTFYRSAGNINTGTLDPDRFSAYDDLLEEGYLGDAIGDLAQNNGVVQRNLNADYIDGMDSTAMQQRVIGTCASGQAMVEVYAGGGVRCQTVGGAGDITSVTAGTGLTGGGGSGDVSLAVSFASVQARVQNPCPSGQAVSGIAESGAVSCVPVGGAGDITSVTAGTGLTGGGGSGDVTLAVNFGSSGTAVTAARSDHTHNYDSIYVNEGQAGSVTAAMLADGAALNEIVDDDGSGSDLDADQLDGHDSAYFARSGSARVTAEISVTCGDECSSEEAQLMDASLGFCFLTKVQMDGIDEDGESRCRIYLENSFWTIEATHASSGDDANVVCGARCYQW